MTEHPILIIFTLIISIWFLRIWIQIYSKNKALEKENPNTEFSSYLPGATTCPRKGIIIACVGIFILTILETIGEEYLGISNEQTDIAAIAIIPYICAAFTEEIIFRGILVIERRGEFLKWGSIIFFSLFFALIHNHLWTYSEVESTNGSYFSNLLNGFSFHFSTKAFFSTFFLFIGSLWFYFVRFFRWNPNASLLAPFIAHLCKNLIVFVIKLANGHVTTWF